MPRKKADKATMQSLYSDIGPVTDSQRMAAERRTQSLQASLRGDMAGSALETLAHPVTAQQRSLKVWEFYNSDPLFRRMVDRSCDFAANGSRWEVPPKDDDDADYEQRTENWSKGAMARAEREERIWKAWSEEVNIQVPNILPGLNTVGAWGCRHSLLSGMSSFQWELGEFKFGKQTFLMPMKITIHPMASTMLRREQALFVDEEIWIKKPLPTPKEQSWDSPYMLQESMSIEAQPTSIPGVNRMANYVRIAYAGEAELAGETEGYVLKYNWSPGDATTTRMGNRVFTGQSIYPTPPFIPLLPIMALRQKHFAADLAILDGIINFLMLWKIGDKDHPPKGPAGPGQKGTIATVRELIQAGLAGPGVELFLPYYVDLDIKMPDTSVLTNTEKYTQSTLEILQCFPPDQLVTTRRGHVPIGEVVVGDEVLTGEGRWRRVEQVHQRHFEGELVGLSTGTGRRLWCTEGHSILSRYRKKDVYWHSTQKAWRWTVGPNVEPEPPIWRLAGGLEAGDLVQLPVDRTSYEDRVPVLKLAASDTLEEDGGISLTITGRHPDLWSRPADAHPQVLGTPDELTEDLADVWAVLGSEPTSVQEVIRRCGLHQVTVYKALVRLQRLGLAHREKARTRPTGTVHPRGVSMPSEVVVDERLAEVLGMYLAEGCIAQRHGSGTRKPHREGLVFAFHKEETSYHDLVVSVMKEKFGVDAKVAFVGNCARITVHSRILAETFLREIGSGAHNKRVPTWLVDAPRRIVAAWIRGLFKGDGSRSTGQWSLGIVSREMALQTLDSIRKMGYRASVVDHPNSGSKKNPEVPYKRVWRVAVSTRGPSFDALMETGDLPATNQIEMWVPLKSTVKRQYNGPVYDLTVAEDHTFTTESIQVANSFGIIFSPPSVREKMERINVSQFEEFLATLRAHIQGFMHLLARRVIELNPGKFSTRPIWQPNPLNTKSDAFMQELMALAGIGRVSWQTLLQYHGLNDDVEARRIAETIGRKLNLVLDNNTPVSYKQTTEGPGDAPSKQTAITPVDQKGRPTGPDPRAIKPPKASKPAKPGIAKPKKGE